MKNEWNKIDKKQLTNGLPSQHLICEWKHPEYGIIEGSIIPGYEDSIWILPSDWSAEIWLGEFTMWRKISKGKSN